MADDSKWGGLLSLEDGRLSMNAVPLSQLAEQYGTPLFVFSESRIRENIARIAAIRDHIQCPLMICYAAKANSTMAILRVVNDAQCDIEVNSGGELWKALKVGFRGDQIIFNGTSKDEWELELAIENGVYAIQVDSLYELSLTESIARSLNKSANVSLRLVPGIEAKTHSGLQTALLTSKFGMMPDEALAAFRLYRDTPHLDLAGIHLHIGSQVNDAEVYTQALRTLFSNVERIYKETGVRIKHVNLGGGFPVDYLREFTLASGLADDQQNILSASLDPATAVGAAWDAVKSDAAGNNTSDLLDELTLLLEPGRSIISDAGICLTTVRNFKQRPIDPLQKIRDEKVSNVGPSFASNEDWLFTDAGFNILLSMETYKWYYHLVSVSRPAEPHDHRYKVAGPLCDGGDVYFDIEGKERLPEHRLLPADVKPGEILALLNCGAYSLAQASQYNGRFIPAVVMVREDGTADLIRSRESFEDLIAHDLF